MINFMYFNMPFLFMCNAVHQSHGATSMTQKRNGLIPCRLDAFVVWSFIALIFFSNFKKTVNKRFYIFFIDVNN